MGEYKRLPCLAYIADMMEFWDVEFWDEKSISGRREEAALARGPEGEAKGEAKNRAETARRMLDMNFTSEQIAQATGLSPDEIEALRDGQSNYQIGRASCRERV